jgi:hypothetical protein
MVALKDTIALGMGMVNADGERDNGWDDDAHLGFLCASMFYETSVFIFVMLRVRVTPWLVVSLRGAEFCVCVMVVDFPWLDVPRFMWTQMSSFATALYPPFCLK